MAGLPAFEALYRGHFGLVWSVVARAGIAPGAREDAVQEIWMTVHRRLHSYDGSSPVASWVAGIARHVVWRQLRAVIRARRKLAALDRVTPEAIDEPMRARERLRGIESVVEGLEPIFRAVFVQVEILGSTGPEAARELGVPLNTLYSRLRLARARVQAGLDALEHEPFDDAPPGLATRTWAAIAPGLAISGAAPMTMVVFAGGLATAVIAGFLAVGVAGLHREPVSRPHVPPEPPVSARASVTAPAEPPPNEPVVVASAFAPPTTETRASSGARARVELPQASAAEVAEVDDEAALLATALARLAERDAIAAWRAIAAHERRFPEGTLVLERRVARVRALCLLGRTAQATRDIEALRRDHVDKAAIAALADGCLAAP